MPLGSHTFEAEHESPVRHGIVLEHIDPTLPPGGMLTSTGPSPVSPPSFGAPPVPPNAPPEPPLPVTGLPSKSKGAVTGLESLQPMSAPAPTSASQPVVRTARKLFFIANLVKLPRYHHEFLASSQVSMWAMSVRASPVRKFAARSHVEGAIGRRFGGA
jgi:hypothetical protein